MPAVMPHPAASPSQSAAPALRGWQLLACLGRSKFAEVWKARSPQGDHFAVKIIHGLSPLADSRSPRLLAAVRLAQLRHPALLEVVHVRHDAGRILLITPLADRTLRDRLEECQAAGRAGVPRDELLEYLHGAAKALDFLHAQRNLHHLALSPRNLLLKGNRLLVADYGVVEQLWAPDGLPYAQYNPRYAAPELFRDQPHPASDQYSLALIYQEMLTGRLPQREVGYRRRIRTRSQIESDLAELPAVDQIILARALDVDPDRRFPSCTNFIEALRNENPAEVKPQQPQLVVSPAPLVSPLPRPNLTKHVQLLVQSARGEVETRCFRRGRYQLTPDLVMKHHCAAWLPPGVAWRKLEGLLNEWGARVIRCEEEQIIFYLERAPSVWQRLLSATGTLIEVRVQLARTSSNLTQVDIEVCCPGQTEKRARKTVEQMGPQLLDQLRAHLLATPERRGQDRFAFHDTLRLAEDRQGLAFSLQDAIAKDISLGGIGFYTRQPPPSTILYLKRAGEQADDEPPIPAAVTRLQRTTDGWYEAGARILYNLDPDQPGPAGPDASSDSRPPDP